MLRRTATQKAHVVWEGGWGALSTRVSDGAGRNPFHPELAFWLRVGEGYILGNQVVEPGDGQRALVELLPEVMRRPAVGRPHRPGKLRVRDPETAAQLTDTLGHLEVVVEAGGELRDWQAAFDEANAVTSPVEDYHPATSAQVDALGALFQAAAAFYRTEPWRLLGDGQPISLHLPGPRRQTLGITVMGVGGENRGLVVFPTIEGMQEFYTAVSAGDSSDFDLADVPPAISLSFSTAVEMPEGAVEEVSARGWDLAAPEAYPLLLATEPGEGCFLDLSPESILLMTIALRAVSAFVSEASAALQEPQPSVIRDLEVELAGAMIPVRLACPPALPGPTRRIRRPGRGSRHRDP
jgi:hypothetical protein